ncbi:hypothetical protein V2J09_016849 [Rumex salicifolius]
MGEKSSAQRINLFCPSLSKLATIVAWDDQLLDLGTIARTFGLDPATLKLNGHFISRGVDLVASSVTWKSLLSFFSARGLSTGAAGSPALLVHGKLCKSGAKRAHDPAELENPGCANTSLHGGIVVAANPESTPKKLKLKENSSAGFKLRSHDTPSQVTNQDGLGTKRKLRLEAISSLKRSKTDGSNLNPLSKSKTRYEFKGEDMPGSNPPKHKCNYQSGTMKRAREEQVLVGAAAYGGCL